MNNKLNLSFLIVVVSLCLSLAMSAFGQDTSFDGQSPEAPAASLYVDNFTYSGALTNNGWAAHSGAGTNALSTTTGLTFTGYPGSGTGNGVLVQGLGGEDDSVLLTAPQTANGNVYYSLLVNVNDAATDKTGDYFFHIGTRASPTSFVSFAARLFARIVGGNVNFGISNGSTTPVYGTTNFSKNTTYLVIVKYTLNTSGNDPVSLWVIPAASGVPATEAAAGTPEAAETTTLGQDVIDALAIRQGTNGTSTQEVVDGIRVGTTWADITGAAAPAAGGPRVFTTVMSGANEAPNPNASTGRGFGRAVLSADETQLTASFYWEGLGSNTTIGHIHTGAVGVAGPITFDMAPAAGAPSGTVVDKVFAITAAQVATLRAGGMYFNVHSTVFPAGELRGQLKPILAKSDFDGDGKTDYGVLRQGTTTNQNQLSWLIKFNGGADIRKDWGLITDTAVPADYDGDGKEDVAVWRPSPSPATLYVLKSTDSTFMFGQFGISGDQPVVRDYTGDGKADFAVYRATTGTFWYNPSSGPFLGHPVSVTIGASGDFPVPGDFNGDGKADFCVFHNTGGTGTFNIRYGTDTTAPGDPSTTTYFGRFTTDFPVAADYDGDGKTDLAVTRTEAGQIVWYYLPSSGGPYQRLPWGVSNDLQVPGDYDGDGKTDFAIWRGSQTAGATAFYVLGSQSGFIFQQWGTFADTPVNFDVLQ